MKKKIVSLLMVATMAASMLVGCGGSSDKPLGVTDGGKVLNIRVWNEEFKERVEEFYPGYEKTDDATVGKIGDVTVKWNITENKGNAYQDALDTALLNQAKASADDRVDIFLVEADYALKYVNSTKSAKIADVGVTDADVANQYKYTKDIVTDSTGALKGISWQGCPGLVFYNREIAKEVLGSDDPDTVQAAISDWTKFAETAAKMAESGYHMTSSVNDTYRTFSNNVSKKWVENGKVVIDDNIKTWVDMSKAMYDAGQTADYDLWSDDWAKGFYPEGKVFCYFGPAWFINFSMHCDDERSVGFNGGWGATEGPQGFYWGGTWICAADGTDNSGLVADIMKSLCCNSDIMKQIVEKKDDFVNDQPAMEAMANTSYASKPMGGQNPLGKYAAAAKNISLDNLTAYDQGCNEEFQTAMKGYFNGSYASYDDALQAFYKAVKEKYPELTY